MPAKLNGRIFSLHRLSLFGAEADVALEDVAYVMRKNFSEPSIEYMDRRICQVLGSVSITVRCGIANRTAYCWISNEDSSQSSRPNTIIPLPPTGAYLIYTCLLLGKYSEKIGAMRVAKWSAGMIRKSTARWIVRSVEELNSRVQASGV